MLDSEAAELLETRSAAETPIEILEYWNRNTQNSGSFKVNIRRTYTSLQYCLIG